MTAACAVCHDHKYDPLSQREFYELSAFFNNSTVPARDGNIKDSPPIITVPQAEDKARHEALPAEIKVAKERVDKRNKNGKKDFDSWLKTARPEIFSSKLPQDQPQLHVLLDDNQERSIATKVNGESRTLTLAANASWQEGVLAEKAFTVTAQTIPEIADAGDFERDQAFSFGAWVWLSPEDREGAILSRMDVGNAHRGWDLWLEGGMPGAHIIHNWPEDALKVVGQKRLGVSKWIHLFVTYDGSSKASGVKLYVDGEPQALSVAADKLNNSIRATVPFRIGQRDPSTLVQNAGVQDVRLYNRALSADEIKALGQGSELAWLLAKSPEHRGKKENAALYTGWLNFVDQEYQAATSALSNLEGEKAGILARGFTTHVMQEKETEPEAFLLYRGEYDKRRDRVTPGTPAILPPMPESFPRNRLGFAQWLLLPDHPQTARVTVNRFWQE